MKIIQVLKNMMFKIYKFITYVTGMSANKSYNMLSKFYLVGFY